MYSGPKREKIDLHNLNIFMEYANETMKIYILHNFVYFTLQIKKKNI